MERYPADATVFLSFCRFGANLVNMKIYDMMDKTELISVCNNAVKLDPTNAEALIVLGSAYTLQMKFSAAWHVKEPAKSKRAWVVRILSLASVSTRTPRGSCVQTTKRTRTHRHPWIIARLIPGPSWSAPLLRPRRTRTLGSTSRLSPTSCWRSCAGHGRTTRSSGPRSCT